MKYKAIIMVPKVVQFENSGNNVNVGNQAWAMCNNFDQVKMADETHVPRLLLIVPETIASLADQPLVFDPPPMAA